MSLANASLPTNPTNSLLAKAQAIARAVQKHGGRALLVGGYVRDELLGLEPKDADLEVYGIAAPTLRELLGQFGRVDCVGESYRVYKLSWRQRTENSASQSTSGQSTSGQSTSTRYELDVSLPRRDKKVGEGHRGFEVEGDPFASIEDAARRRDFTINAILRDPLTNEILDPFGGRLDLKAKLLRAVDFEHFGEDSLRVLRAAQFAARFGLAVEEQTVALCRSLDLHDLPRERIWGEWEKLLIKAPQPSLGLRAAWQLGILEQLFPYLQSTLARRGAELLSTLDGAARVKTELEYPRQVTVMLAVLGIFLGWRSKSRHGIERLLDDLNIHTLNNYDVRKNVIWLVGERKRAFDWFRRRDTIEDKEFRFLAARGDRETQLIYYLTRARGAFHPEAMDAAEWFRSKMQELEVWSGPPSPLLMGRHLLEMGMKPGPQIGRIVQAVYAAQLAGEVTNLAAAQELAQQLMNQF